MAGKFITFEGGEGAGKSTQVERLAARLTAAGLTVVVTREPGGTPTAEAIREFVLQGLAVELGARGEALLMATARAKSQTMELAGSHAIYISHASEVAALIERAAQAAD